MALFFACVKWGGMYHACYANILYDMMKRNLPPDCDFTFQCFTDDAGGLDEGIAPRPLPGDLEGWWNKLWLFKRDLFPPGARVVYCDLDTLVTGPLDALMACDADFALLRDFYRPGGYGSGVMLWRSGACDAIWDSYEAAGRPVIAGGDQAWIERVYPHAALLQDRLPGFFASYKQDCAPLPPASASIVAFHGEPKQDNCGAGWVADIWKTGAAAGMQAYSAKKDRSFSYPRIAPLAAHTRPLLVAGNAARLPETIRECPLGDGMEVMAVGGAAVRLEQGGIPLHAHVMRQGDASHVPQAPLRHYYAETCAADICAAARGEVTVWNPAEAPFEGLSTGLCALHIAFMLGYRQMHLAGFDGCYHDGKRRQDAERIAPLIFAGTPYTVAPWQRAQALQFALLAEKLIEQHCVLHVYGEGLIPAISRQLIHSKEK